MLPEDQTSPLNPVGDSIPGDPANVLSGNDKAAEKASSDRAATERALLTEGADPDELAKKREPIATNGDPAEIARQTTTVGGAPGDDLPAAASTGPDLMESTSVKNLGQEILSTFLANLRGLTPTDDERAIGLRAAEELAYFSIAVIGLSPDQQANYADRAKRANSTLLNLAVGFSVDAKRVARDSVRQTIQRFFREAIGFISGATALV